MLSRCSAQIKRDGATNASVAIQQQSAGLWLSIGEPIHGVSPVSVRGSACPCRSWITARPSGTVAARGGRWSRCADRVMRVKPYKRIDYSMHKLQRKSTVLYVIQSPAGLVKIGVT